MKDLSKLSYREFLQYMEVLGDPDPVIRDEVGFASIDEFIYSDKFPSKWCADLLQDLFSSQFVFSDLLVKRSFSLLVVSAVICVDYEKQSIDLRWALEQLRLYLKFENEWIGNCEKVGLVHNLAHFADAIGPLVTHPSSTKELRDEILLLVETTLEKTKGTDFVLGEVERLERVRGAVSSIIE